MISSYLVGVRVGEAKVPGPSSSVADSLSWDKDMRNLSYISQVTRVDVSDTRLTSPAPKSDSMESSVQTDINQRSGVDSTQLHSCTIGGYDYECIVLDASDPKCMDGLCVCTQDRLKLSI